MSNTSNMLVGLLGVAAIGGAVVQGNRPPTDVNVVNTPTVNVGSLPAVQVSSLPAVQIQDNREQIYILFQGSSTSLVYQTPSADQYVVPEGKRLNIRHVSATVATGPGIEVSFMSIRAQKPGIEIEVEHHLNVPRPSALNSDNRMFTSTSQEMDIVAEAGDKISFGLGRTEAFVNTPAAVFNTHISGYLTNVP